ncbi:MAG: HBL/NHE enterotoxin family protein [Synergistaceae bacterium]|nr:HBL/NHE enterotoxin family protein [Synergistaceae bacterium]MBR0256957.1 HBL/NHE enterotoxin family protein [Synergistaceae bacterium]
MKKVCVMVMLLVFAFGTAGYGAVSDDVYVRKDVFEAYMHRVDDKLDMILGLIREQREEHKAQIAELKEEIKGIREEHKAQIAELKEEIKGVREEHKAQIAELKEEIKGVREEHKAQITELREEQKALRKDIEALSNRVSELTGRVEGLDARLGDLRNDIYLGLVILGIIVGLPAVQKIFQSIADRKPSLTVEDVIRLIEENNIKLSGKTQA